MLFYFLEKKKYPRTTCRKNRAKSSCPLRGYVLCVDGTGWPLGVPLCCLYRFSYCETWGGVKQNLVALVSFFSFAFSSDVNPADPLYSLRRGSPPSPSFGCHGYEVSLSLVKLKCVFLSRGLLMANILDYCYWQFKAAQAALPSLKIEVDHKKKRKKKVSRHSALAGQLNGHSLNSIYTLTVAFLSRYYVVGVF